MKLLIEQLVSSDLHLTILQFYQFNLVADGLFTAFNLRHLVEYLRDPLFHSGKQFFSTNSFFSDEFSRKGFVFVQPTLKSQIFAHPIKW